MPDFDIVIGNIISGAAGGVVGGLIGGYASHRWSLRRDRRKDFNEAVTPIRERLSKFHNGRIIGLPSALELQRLDSLMSWGERRRLRAAIQNCRSEYDKQHSEDAEADRKGVYDTDIPAVERAIAAVLKELAPR